MTTPDLAPLPPQPAGIDWPTRGWPAAPFPARADRARFEALLDRAFAGTADGPMGATHALVVVQGGAIVAERYGDGFGPEATYPSWSMAKSITQLLIGFLAAEGRVDVDAALDAPEWRTPGDPRAGLTWRSLLHMTSGLSFVEVYLQGQTSDVIEMLFQSGKADVAGYAASRPLAHAPDTVFNYASGTTNVLARALGGLVGGGEPGMRAFMRERLFGPLGIEAVEPKFDAAGTFIGSSYCFMPARDFAKIGLLAMRGGLWEGRELLPRAWIDFARTPGPVPLPRDQYPDGRGYGAHWWLDVWGPGSFSMNGYAGQYCILISELDLIVVRHGESVNAPEVPRQENVAAWLRDLIACFRP